MISSPPARRETLRVQPRGTKYRHGVAMQLNPDSSALIKEEPGTIIWRETLPDGEDAAIKLYRRGFSAWVRSRLTVFRARHEFDGLSHLESLGIPCSHPLFWCHGRFGAHGWGEMLATRWVPESRPLADVLASHACAGGGPDLAPLFAFVARMHDAGIRHGTLLSRNVMLRTDAPKPAFVFIDMPRFHRFPHCIRNTRMARYDLLYLCDSLAAHFSADAVPIWLTAYGMPAGEQTDFLAKLKTFRNTSTLRRIVGAEFNLRYLASRIFRTPLFTTRQSGRSAPGNRPC